MADEAAPVLLLWDVDLTLIENGGVSKENYALAFEILTGRAPGPQPGIHGRTDLGIMAGLLAANGEDPAAYPLERQWDALVAATDRNSAALARRGHALPGAAACLQRAAREPGVRQSVLTGNVKAMAALKLRRAGLGADLDLDAGAYGDVHEVRAELVTVARRAARRLYGLDFPGAATVLVGDTPLDVEAALATGARAVAVATGSYPAADLTAAGAHVVLPDLTDTARVVAAVTGSRPEGGEGPAR